MADWQTADKVQVNEAGGKRALVGGAWIPVAQAQKNDAGQYRVMLSDAETASPTLMQKVQASVPGRVVQGLRDSIDAGAQFISHAVPESVTNVLDIPFKAMRDSDSPALQTIGDTLFADPRAGATDKRIHDTEQEYQASRRATTAPTLSGLITGQNEPGMDVARFAGQVASPTNAAIAAKLPAAAVSTIPRMFGTGASVGGAGGLLTPVTGDGFWGTKAAQTGLGAATGAVVTPVLGATLKAAAPYVGRIVDKLSGQPEIVRAKAAREVDNVLAQALRDVGQTIDDIPKLQYDALRQQVSEALKKGQKLDAAAVMRKGDFEALGLPHTLGQITRDPTQFARERNLRGVAGVGDPLMQRFEVQNQALQGRAGEFAKGASERVTAGEKIAEALQGIDRGMKGKVDSAYSSARDNLGRASPMDSSGFTQQANLALDEGMLAHYLPAEVRNMMNGVAQGKIPFNVQTSVQMDQILSAAQRSAGKGTPQSLAIGKVRDALNSAGIESNVGVDAKKAFDVARGMAKERFATHDAIPALKAAANGEVPPDAFVRKFVTGGNAAEVKKLADALRTTSPEAYQEARAQLGSQIQRAAFGENLAGDKLLAPERLSRALREIGTEKLSAFFDTGEIETMKRMARVGAYINSSPGAAAVNTSNTAAAAANLVGSSIPGLSAPTSFLKMIAGPVLNQRAVSRAVAAEVPSAAAGASPEAINKARLAAALMGLGSGEAVAPR